MNLAACIGYAVLVGLFTGSATLGLMAGLSFALGALTRKTSIADNWRPR